MTADQHAPPYQTDFPPEEFRARWGRVFDAVGAHAVALLAGAPQVGGFTLPRQTNDFYYLCGVETPHAYLLLDGGERSATICLPARDPRMEQAEGRLLSANDADVAMRLTGADAVMSTRDMTVEWMRGLLQHRGAIYTPFAPAEGNAQCRHELLQVNSAVAADPWDGRPSREGHLVGLLRSRFPRADVLDLTPVLDALRAVKSPREIALIRRASRIAGLGILEAMRCTRPGLYEYQLDAAARYVFLVNGARLEGYRSITAAGTNNIWNMHYYRNNGVLRDRDLVLMDFSPECGGYTSDVTRMWPVSGRFGAWQRELLQFVLDYRNAILPRIRPGVTPEQIMDEARAAMAPVFEAATFSKPAYEAAARKLVETGGGAFSHPVGMAVHDDGAYRPGPLQTGHVFTIDPQLFVPDESLYIRYEDPIVVTEEGCENMTAFLPSELDDIERIVGSGGVVQSCPREPIR